MNGTQEQPVAAEPAVGWVLAEDWTRLKGRMIEVYDHGELVDAGKVDTVTPKGDLLWLAFNGVHSRRIVERLAETCVRILPDE
ncbi:hypothetical protein AB0N65_06695 [Paenarthrobacter sp. NPDC089322]|uniref:hypothetical protein n=1 Tax=Paenarthrobacter sp. NPDC089322 TaxID=3155065 RepID=UPI0034405C1B